MVSKNKLGQYFTTSIELQEMLFSFILNEPINILEPSIGRGDLIVYIQEMIPSVIFDMYEIDDTIELLDGMITDDINYCDFMKQNITKTYKTIIGNPPYVRTKKGNLYIDFINKCYELLDIDGELIFIVPSDFLKLTSASKLLNKMLQNGTITHIYHPHNERLFENASIDVIIFRYYKNVLYEKVVLYNGDLLYITNSDGLITFSEKQTENMYLLKDYFNVYVGIVSGKESVYKNEELGNIEVLTSENKLNKYIFITEFPCIHNNINDHLLTHKSTLINRKIKKFNDKNWFEWGAPRNISTINANMGKECIYIYNLTRKSCIAFVGRVNYFGGNLIMLIPKQDYNLNNIVSYLNSNSFKNNFMYSGRFKIGHRQICNSYIDSSYIL
jgi:adenine-specific DNA-methyltransferase